MNVRLATTDRIKTVAHFHVILILWQWQNQYQYQPAPEIYGGSAECWLILIAGRSKTSVHLFIYLPLLLMTDLLLWHIEDCEKNIVCVSLQMFHSYVFIFSLMNCSALLLFKTWKKGWFILEALPSDSFFFLIHLLLRACALIPLSPHKFTMMQHWHHHCPFPSFTHGTVSNKWNVV